MGTELQRRGIDTGLPLWSAGALLTRPDEVRAIHREYIDAGADIITTNTFRTTRRMFTRAGLPDRSSAATTLAVSLALEARSSTRDTKVLVAGSIAPLEDCYRPDLVPPDEELRTEHAELAARLAAAGVDFLLVETMNTIREARAACAAAVATGKEVVVSFILDNAGDLYGGESLAEAIAALAPLRPTGFSINCVSPRFLGKSVPMVRSLTPLPIAVYGNVGVPEQESGWEFTNDVGEDEYRSFAREWHRAGAAIVGGCCGTTPAYIAALASLKGR